MRKIRWFGGTVLLFMFVFLFAEPAVAQAGTITTNMSAEEVKNNLSDGPFTEGLGTLTTGYTYHANLAVTSDVMISKARITFYKNGSYYSSYSFQTGHYRWATYPVSFNSAGSYSYKWSVEYDGGGSQDMTGYFTVQDFQLYFNANGGSVSPAIKGVKYGVEIGTVPTPVRTGYSFTGWYTSASGGDHIGAPSKCMVAYTGEGSSNSITLYAHWKVNEYNVYFNANGGTVSTGSKKVTYSSNYGTLPWPSRTGYMFAGWYTAANGGNERTWGSTVNTAGDHTLYAHWTANAYNVYFNANGGTVSTGSKKVTYGGNYGTLPWPSRTGYTFAGWYTAANGGNERTWWSTVNTAGSQTLYAHWTANSYTVYFNANGGTVSNGSKKVTYGSSYGTLPQPNRTGYTFAGWYTAANGGSERTWWSTVDATVDQTLYAHWTANIYTVYFNANGGNVSQKSKMVAVGSSYGTLPKPTRTGYYFNGWYTASGGGNLKTAKTEVTTAKNHTLYAQWIKKKEYTVSFNANKGKVQNTSKTVTIGETYGILPIPVRTGYDFAGWYTKISGGENIEKNTIAIIDKNHTLYARWKAKEYKIVFNANGGKNRTKSKKVTYGKTYGNLPVPSRNNYIFQGWYTKKSGGSRIKTGTAVHITKSHTLYARWKVTKPKITTKVTAKMVSSNNIEVTWKKVEGAKGYVVYRADSKNGYYKKCAEVKRPSYIDKRLKPGRTYYYKMAAYKVVDKKMVYGGKSAAVGKRVIGRLAVPIQNKIIADKENKNLIISWKPVKNAERIEIFVSINGKKGIKIDDVSEKRGNVSYPFSNFPKGNSYIFAVRAYYKIDGIKIYSDLSCAYKFSW